MKLTENLAKYAGLQWSQLSSAELSQSYKPDPKVYLDAAERVGAKPGECALVAAHLYDLEAAVLCGWKSIYVERTGEEKWKSQRIEEAKQWVDDWVTKDEDGLLAAAQKLGKAGDS